MSSQTLDSRFTSIFLSEEDIANCINKISKKIVKSFKTKSIHMLCILKGASFFSIDLARALSKNGIKVKLDFISASTYKTGIKDKSIRKTEVKGLPETLENDNVLIVDDIFDQGFTLSAIKEKVLQLSPASVKTCVLLKKILKKCPNEILEIRNTSMPDYFGSTVPDKWVVGYGLDISDEFRELPYIAFVNEKYFK